MTSVLLKTQNTYYATGPSFTVLVETAFSSLTMTVSRGDPSVTLEQVNKNHGVAGFRSGMEVYFGGVNDRLVVHLQFF